MGSDEQVTVCDGSSLNFAGKAKVNTDIILTDQTRKRVDWRKCVIELAYKEQQKLWSIVASTVLNLHVHVAGSH